MTGEEITTDYHAPYTEEEYELALYYALKFLEEKIELVKEDKMAYHKINIKRLNTLFNEFKHGLM